MLFCIFLVKHRIFIAPSGSGNVPVELVGKASDLAKQNSLKDLQSAVG